MHSHTHTYAGSCHALRTYVCLHIFRHLPHTALSYSLRYPHPHTYTLPPTNHWQTKHADTEYSKNVQIDYTASTPCARAHTYTGSCYALRTHIHLHIVRQQYSHICVPAHIRTYTPLITGRQSISTQTQTRHNTCKNARFGRAKVPVVRGLPLLDPHLKHCCRLGGTHMHMDGGHDMEPEVLDMTTWN